MFRKFDHGKHYDTSQSNLFFSDVNNRIAFRLTDIARPYRHTLDVIGRLYKLESCYRSLCRYRLLVLGLRQ